MRRSTCVQSVLLCLGLMTGLAAAQQDVQQDTEVIAEPGGAIMIQSQTLGDGGEAQTEMRVMALDVSEMGDGAFFMSTDSVMAAPLPMPFGGDPFSMLNNPSVQKDLELVDDQVQRIRDINAEFSKQISEQMKSFQGEGGALDLSRAKELGEMIRKLKEQQKSELDNILLPHQQERLKQVSLQMQMQAMGTARTLSSKLAEELGISEEQKQRLKQRQEELNKELQEKIKAWREQARKELMKELTPEQRKKLEDMLGASFEMKSEDFEAMRPNRRSIQRRGNRNDR